MARFHVDNRMTNAQQAINIFGRFARPLLN